MVRPALQRLLAEIQAGQVDCIVIYKVDRLSRSLFDFARIMQILEKHGTGGRPVSVPLLSVMVGLVPPKWVGSGSEFAATPLVARLFR